MARRLSACQDSGLLVRNEAFHLANVELGNFISIHKLAMRRCFHTNAARNNLMLINSGREFCRASSRNAVEHTTAEMLSNSLIEFAWPLWALPRYSSSNSCKRANNKSQQYQLALKCKLLSCFRFTHTLKIKEASYLKMRLHKDGGQLSHLGLHIVICWGVVSLMVRDTYGN